MGFQKKTLLLIVAAAVFAQIRAQVDDQQLTQNILKNRRLPGLNKCGKGKSTDRKIIDGTPAELGEFPWMAVIGYGYNEGDNPEWLCGGSLITDQYVITAAHCLHPVIIKLRKVIVVRLGELNLDPSYDDGANHIDCKVGTITYHEQYDSMKKINDIGLIKLKEKVSFSENLSPICLSLPEFQTDSFEGHHPVVAGWGRTIEDLEAFDTRLMKVEVEIQNNTVCKINNTSTYVLRNAVIDDRVICASASGKDTCRGDSGGPLMYYRNDNGSGNTFLMGMVSYGYECAREDYPAVYVRVAKYMRWIMDNLEI